MPSLETKKNVSLLGMCFLSFKPNGHTLHQGEIIGIDGDLCICQLYSWESGTETDCMVFPREDLLIPGKYALYKNHEDRNYAFDTRFSKRDEYIRTNEGQKQED